MNRKDKIIQVATRLFAYQGFTDTSTAQLAQACEVAEGTIFYHFKTKEDLFIAVLQNLRETILREFEAFQTEHQFPSGLQMIEGTIYFYFHLASHMEYGLLLIHRYYPHLIARENPVCREHLVAIYESLIDLFEKALQRLAEDGVLKRPPSRKTAMILFTLVDGLARLKTYNLYEAGLLYEDCVKACLNIVTQGEEKPC
jgi:AcrR family transcriptional regulator